MAAKRRTPPKPKRAAGKHSRRPLVPPRDTSRDEQIEAALAAWIRLGSSRAAALEVGIDDSTIRTWKDRHPDVWARVSHAHAQKVRALREATASIAAEGMKVGAEKLKARIESDEMEDRDLCAAQRELRETDAHADRIARLDAGVPTDHVTVDVGGEAVEALKALAGELRK